MLRQDSVFLFQLEHGKILFRVKGKGFRQDLDPSLVAHGKIVLRFLELCA